MKVPLFVFHFLSASVPLLAEPVKVPEWRTFRDVHFTKVEGDRVKFFHRDGVGKALISELPLEVQKKVAALPVEDEVVKAEKTAKARAAELRIKYREDFGGILKGEVLQVTDEGVMVTKGEFQRIKKEYAKEIKVEQYYELGSANFGRAPRLVERRSEVWNVVPTQKIDGAVFLYCDSSSMRVKQVVSTECYPAGRLNYVSKGGEDRSILALADSLDKSIEVLTKRQEAEAREAALTEGP